MIETKRHGPALCIADTKGRVSTWRLPATPANAEVCHEDPLSELAGGHWQIQEVVARPLLHEHGILNGNGSRDCTAVQSVVPVHKRKIKYELTSNNHNALVDTATPRLPPSSSDCYVITILVRFASVVHLGKSSDPKEFGFVEIDLVLRKIFLNAVLQGSHLLEGGSVGISLLG